MKSNIVLISPQDTINVKQHILHNRGIKNASEYINLTNACECSPSEFGEELLERGVKMIDDAIQNDSNIYVLVDTDVDGYCSASLIMNFLGDLYRAKHVRPILNKGKNHGLTLELVNKLIEVRNTNGHKDLLIIPDAGSNDTEQCGQLSEFYDILILDHHDVEKENPHAVVINPYCTNYRNKNISGTAVTYRFAQYLDEINLTDYAERFTDLVALSMISDVMDLRVAESRYLTTLGLQNIHNKLIQAVIKKREYNISNVDLPNAIDIGFYVVPLLNACIRKGSDEEKKLLLRAFMENDKGETFPYKPRKSKDNPNPTEQAESLYDHIARVCVNIKAKQDKECEKGSSPMIDAGSSSEDVLVVFENDEMSAELTGLVANKVCNAIKKPTLILRKLDCEEGKTPLYTGSARNFNNSFVGNFKQEIINSGCVKEALGHESAFGVKIYENNIPKLIEYFNNKFKDTSTSRTYFVDFLITGSLPYRLIREIDEMKSLFSSFVEQPYIGVSEIAVSVVDINVQTTPSNGNVRFSFVHDDIEYVKFKLPSDDPLLNVIDNLIDEVVVFNMVGKTSINVFGGKSTPQFIIEDYDIEVVNPNESEFNTFDDDEWFDI